MWSIVLKSHQGFSLITVLLQIPTVANMLGYGELLKQSIIVLVYAYTLSFTTEI